MFIPDPDFYPSWIPDPKTATKGRGENFLLFHFCSHKLHKIKSYFIFKMLKKKFLSYFQRIIEVLPKKLSQSSQNMGLGCGIRKKKLFRIPNPGGQKPVLRIRESPGSGAFFIPGSGIRNRFFPDPRYLIPDPKPIFWRA
jgi:hypothetical protein